MIQADTLNLTAADVTGQKQVKARRVPADASIRELLDGLIPRLQLHQTDRHGQAVQYQARLEREQRHLNLTERVGDSLVTGDHLILHPRVIAG